MLLPYWLGPDSCLSNCLMESKPTCLGTIMPHVVDPITQISNEGSIPQACPETDWIRKSPEIPSDITGLCQADS